VILPFQWEYLAYPHALRALKKLDEELGYMVVLSSDATANEIGEGATIGDVMRQQEMEFGDRLQMLLKLGTRSIKSLANPSA
jgi:hypothetical protein